ncbi:MAG: ribose ABC transporter permease [Anaerolineales bacterium]|nr:ribose ABC transporter permease [Anaerolineales bacterium]
MSASSVSPIQAKPDSSSRFLFLQKFLRHGTRVASVAPSSRALASALCYHIDPARPQTILELGAGTGAVTTVALERMHRHSTLIALEMDPDFVQIVSNRCPGAYVIQANAATAYQYLQALGVDRVDVIISGLPTPSLPREVNQQIFTCIQEVATAGIFSQLTVMPWVYLRLYRRLFHQVSFTPVWWNIPSGGVYHCRRLREDFAAHLPQK